MREPLDHTLVGAETADIRIEGGSALIDGHFEDAAIVVNSESGKICDTDREARGMRRLDATGLLVLPGIVDIHGDAFEHQMMPRPGVDFALDIALFESDAQAVANGLTTVYHGVTWSWEPGLRGTKNARLMLETIERMRAQLRADTHFHLRHETFNLEAEAAISSWLAAHRIDVLAFNDHMALTEQASARPNKLAGMVDRSGLTRERFLELVAVVKQRASEVPASIERLARVARESGVTLLSHDDTSPEQRRWFRALGCRLAEFPTTVETARDAASAGDHIVLGAPNVVRGGSHTGWIKAADMVAQGLCSILASDYYYPAPLLAAFRLDIDNVASLEQAWALVSQTPAAAVGLADRGVITKGLRADIILVDAEQRDRPRIVATLVSGRIVHLTDATRLKS
jgi:alpha-D-ribose 1-methylphosphonate 5-triphosphate diphosphatase